MNARRGSAVVTAAGAALVLVLAAASTACRRPPSGLELRVEAALAHEPTLQRIHVSADDGVITLAGVVGADSERARLHDLVRAVPGVVAVDDSRVTVAPSPIVTPDDAAAHLAAAIQARLRAAGYLDLDVEVRGKTIRVVGSVAAERHAGAMRVVVETAPRGYRIEDASVETRS